MRRNGHDRPYHPSTYSTRLSDESVIPDTNKKALTGDDLQRLVDEIKAARPAMSSRSRRQRPRRTDATASGQKRRR